MVQFCEVDGWTVLVAVKIKRRAHIDQDDAGVEVKLTVNGGEVVDDVVEVVKKAFLGFVVTFETNVVVPERRQHQFDEALVDRRSTEPRQHSAVEDNDTSPSGCSSNESQNK